MDVLKNVLVLLHFLGFAALAGGAMTQLGQARPTLNRFIKDGAWTQLLTGLALVVFAEFGPLPVNHAKIGRRLIVLVAIIVLVLVNRRKDYLSKQTLIGILGLTVLNAGIAVLWQ